MIKTEFLKRCDDFFAKWLGKNDDFDGAYPNECVDSAKRFMYEVCGIENPPPRVMDGRVGTGLTKTLYPR